MYSAEYVQGKLAEMKTSGKPLQVVAWEFALLCEGWAYVYGARGQTCTPANRRARYSDAHPTIKSKCKNFSGSGTCTGCKWLPGGKRTRFFDCRGFTYWVLLQVYDWKLMGAGATSQWNTESNWRAKGEIATMPENTLCCLFVRNGSKMEHTGFGYNNETVECSAGVQHFTTRKSKWTHWAVPACVYGEVTPTDPKKPTLRRGDTGAYVTLLQSELIQKGYDCGSYGADGKFGKMTETAVKAFQADNPPLAVDGVVDQATWAALETTPTKKYTVTIPHLSNTQADALVSQYPGSTKTEERG